MANPFVDTDVIIRLLTGDDKKKQDAASVLFKKVESKKLTLTAPETVIADSVYVLSSPRLYHLNRTNVQALLLPLLRLPYFKVRNRRLTIRALDIYAATNLDFGDAVIVAYMERGKSRTLYSFDKDFDKITIVDRKIPK